MYTHSRVLQRAQLQLWALRERSTSPVSLLIHTLLYNLAPQWIQLQLWERHKLRTLRLTLADMAALGQLQGEGGTMRLGGPHGGVPVCVFYFRWVRAGQVHMGVVGESVVKSFRPGRQQASAGHGGGECVRAWGRLGSAWNAQRLQQRWLWMVKGWCGGC